MNFDPEKHLKKGSEESEDTNPQGGAIKEEPTDLGSTNAEFIELENERGSEFSDNEFDLIDNDVELLLDKEVDQSRGGITVTDKKFVTVEKEIPVEGKNKKKVFDSANESSEGALSPNERKKIVRRVCELDLAHTKTIDEQKELENLLNILGMTLEELWHPETGEAPKDLRMRRAHSENESDFSVVEEKRSALSMIISFFSVIGIIFKSLFGWFLKKKSRIIVSAIVILMAAVYFLILHLGGGSVDASVVTKVPVENITQNETSAQSSENVSTALAPILTNVTKLFFIAEAEVDTLGNAALTIRRLLKSGELKHEVMYLPASAIYYWPTIRNKEDSNWYRAVYENGKPVRIDLYTKLWWEGQIRYSR